jgi:phosphatidylglycerol:prolipoprotein diacylglycerol transferase
MHLPSLPVHPTQIYESAASLAIAAFCLIYVHPRKRYDGQVFLSFVTLYATARFLIEFLRRDDRGEFLGLSTSQLVGLLLVAGSIAAHRYLRVTRRSKATPGAPGAVPA